MCYDPSMASDVAEEGTNGLKALYRMPEGLRSAWAVPGLPGEASSGGADKMTRDEDTCRKCGNLIWVAASQLPAVFRAGPSWRDALGNTCKDGAGHTPTGDAVNLVTH